MLSTLRSLLRPVVIFLIVPTVVPLLLAPWQSPVRPLVNIDYLLVAAIFPWIPPWLFSALFLAVLLADGLRIAAHMFYFQPGPFISSVAFLPSLDQGFVLLLTGAILAGILLLAIGVLRFLGVAPRAITTATIFLALATALVTLDAATTGNALFRRETAAFGTNLATSSGLATARSLYAEFQNQFGNASIIEGQAQAATDLLRIKMKTGAPVPERVVLVISESWGRLNEPAADELIYAGLDRSELRARYDVQRGTVPFHSSTVPGELRELCGLRVQSVSPRVNQIPGEACLPQQLRAKGYETVAVHGFAGSFFNRQDWYPVLGFDRIYFGRDLERVSPGMPQCGSVFRGHCDRDVFEWISRNAIRPGAKQFIYWLTLNAHIPIVDAGVEVHCERSEVTTRFDTICQLLNLNRVVLESVLNWAGTDAARETGIIVVGDHPPPLLNPQAKAAFDQQRVPYIALWPRTGS